MPCRTSTALRTTTGLILEILSSCAVWTEPPDGRFYTCTGLSAGLNLSLAMIQEDYGAYVAASVGQELLSVKFGQAQCARIRFSHEAVNHVVRVEEKSGHRAVWSNAEALGPWPGPVPAPGTSNSMKAPPLSRTKP